MKTKLICIILAFALNLCACGDSEENRNRSENENIIGAVSSENDNSNVQSNFVNSSVFSGKVKGCYYASSNKIIVAADKLYLYDTQKGESIASVDISIKDLCVLAYSNGYFVVGQGSGSIIGYVLNNDFEIENAISFQGLLSDDFVLGMEDVAISQDGKQIAFGGLRGLYLYDTSTKKVRTILRNCLEINHHFRLWKALI